MPADPAVVQQREAVARAAMRDAFGTPDDESGATLFVSHHLEEIGPEYWQQQLGSATPEPVRVLDIIHLRDTWGGDNDLDTFDFTLPDDVTQYVISVSFDEAGVVEGISMES